MSRNILLFVIIIFTSCDVRKTAGEYYDVGADFKYSLRLNKNHTFLLEEEFIEADLKCNGKWHYLSKDTILLHCNKEDISAMLQRGYMNERFQKVAILNRQQIKIKQKILIKR